MANFPFNRLIGTNFHRKQRSGRGHRDHARMHWLWAKNPSCKQHGLPHGTKKKLCDTCLWSVLPHLGAGYPSYHKILKLGLGIHTLSHVNFYNIVKLAHPCVKSVLDGICSMGKSEMKDKPHSELGSWKKAVSTSDGSWLIRGLHSQCCTFVVINFLTGCTLYYGHCVMRDSNNICDSDLWKGTSKAVEGHLAEVCFTKAKEEGMVVALIGKMLTPRQQNHFAMCSLTTPLAVSCFVEVM